MSDRTRLRTRVAVAAMAAGLLCVAAVAAQQGLEARIAHTNPQAYRAQRGVHAGAGSMSFTGLLNRGAVTPEFNFLHRGEIPAGAGIGHHFHNVAEEMFVILNGEAQFTVDGRTVFATTGGTEFDPGKPAIVFLHGAGFDRTAWRLQTRWFAHHGRAVLAVDFPAHGWSDGPVLDSIPAMADWTARLIEAAGLKQAALVGHSMGALVALDAEQLR